MRCHSVDIALSTIQEGSRSNFAHVYVHVQVTFTVTQTLRPSLNEARRQLVWPFDEAWDALPLIPAAQPELSRVGGGGVGRGRGARREGRELSGGGGLE